ncbi:MAG: putative phage tail protein, partial [Betaproteobacteria bacterium]
PNKYARMMIALLPPGRVWRLIGGSVLATLFAGCADEIGRLDARTIDLLNEADPRTAIETLPEYELTLGLSSTGTNAERSARIVSRLIARQRYRPVDIRAALALLLGVDASAVVLLERTHAFAVTLGDDREIFRFFIYRDPSLPGAYYLASAQALLDSIKPSHTIGLVIESVSALYDDPHSLYDRDLMGA